LGLTKEARREQVVAAVLKLIGKYGVARLTTAALAKEVGMSEANLYRHFQNKQEILSETVKKIGEGLRDNVDAALKSSSAPIDRLKEVFQLHLRYVGQNEGIPRIIFSDEIHTSNAGLKPRFLETISSYAKSLADIVVQGKEDGSIKQSVNAHATALTFIGMIQVTILRWVLSDFTLPIDDEGIILWNNFATCIGT
jgi:AcrR family transcriptional regulator